MHYTNGLVQERHNSIAKELELHLSWINLILVDLETSRPHRELIHWSQVTHIYISKLTTIGSENGLLPRRHQAIIWTNAGILLIGPLRTNFSEILINIHTFSFKKMHLKMSSAKWHLFCLSLNVLNKLVERNVAMI